ncbi:IS66 family transposase [Tundrisphaera lichenicola]|uniref:IS66 family transposase n=1 Tax=Tundrisphaera lichenicola TaxID=2029860 RepID=UPI003EBA1BEE
MEAKTPIYEDFVELNRRQVRQIDALHAELDRLLAGSYIDPAKAKLSMQRELLQLWLDHDEVDATVNLVEREIRPNAIARKLSTGNSTESGEEKHPVLADSCALADSRTATSWVSSSSCSATQGQGFWSNCTPPSPSSPG